MGFEQSSQLAHFLSNPIVLILFAWDVVWKSIALWKAARNDQLYWFITVAILNTVGILPIIYILFFQKGKNKEEKK